MLVALSVALVSVALVSVALEVALVSVALEVALVSVALEVALVSVVLEVALVSVVEVVVVGTAGDAEPQAASASASANTSAIKTVDRIFTKGLLSLFSSSLPWRKCRSPRRAVMLQQACQVAAIIGAARAGLVSSRRISK